MNSETVKFDVRLNSRNIPEYFVKGQHVSLQRLKGRKIVDDPMERYLEKEIPPYPSPVKFLVSDVTHVTEKSGFDKIMTSQGFKAGANDFSWWGLKINENEISDAENLYKEDKNLHGPQPFLKKFTTSPAFKQESRYGNYRFTFPLADVMKLYKEQNCGGREPVLRVHETVTYRKEIMYSVLIHSPEDDKRFGEYPLLENSEWVKYQDGKMMWKAQAICETHSYQFVSGNVQNLNLPLFYVWDHVSLVFHLPNDKTLKIPTNLLKESVSACDIDKIDLTRDNKNKANDEKFEEAVNKMKELKL